MEPHAPPTRRLVRRRDGRMIAGVCEGVADHFQIDPIVVRIGFVIAAFFGGAGVIAYVAGWLLIPEEDDTTSVGERVLREHHWGRIAGIVLIAIAVTSFGGPFWWFRGGTFFAVLLIVGGVLLLTPGIFDRTERTPVAGPPAPPPPAPPPSVPPPSDPPPTTMSFDDAPAPLPAQAPRRRSGLGAITLGLLFVGGGIVGLSAAAGRSVNPTNVFAVGLIVVGAALVISAWVGRSFILIPLGLLLVGLMSVSAVIDVPFRGGIGEKRVQPLVLSDLQDEYHLGIGEMRLDLTHVAFPRGTTTHVEATVGIGHLRIAVPRDVTVVIHGHAGMGEVRFLDQHEGGLDVERDATFPSSGESTPRIEIEADIGIGQVEVTDAAA